MKRAVLLFVLALAAAVSVSAAALQRQQQSFSEKMVRLHVVANSDTVEDQTLKLMVRDAVISVTEKVPKKEELPKYLPRIQAAAEACLAEQNSDYSVTVSLGKERFPTRVYETFSLPSGVYTALRVTIGNGAGKNWWCVAFPSICFRATAADLEEAAVAGGFSQKEIALIMEDNEGYTLKFKLLEWIEQIKETIYDKK